MTLAAIQSKAALMRFILLVAGQTILWCAFENYILMTSLTRRRGVRSRQFKDRAIVVEVHGLPAFDRMTGGTICA